MTFNFRSWLRQLAYRMTLPRGQVRRRKKSNRRDVGQFPFEHLEPVVLLATDTWTGPATGDWGTAANWSAGAPLATSDVSIPAGFTVTFNAGSTTINSLAVAATSTLNVNGNSSINIDRATAVTPLELDGTINLGDAASSGGLLFGQADGAGLGAQHISTIGSGTITLSSDASNLLGGTTDVGLVIDVGITIDGGSGTIGNASAGNLDNQGTIDAAGSGSALTVHLGPTGGANDDVIEATLGGGATVDGGSWTNNASLLASGGATLNVDDNVADSWTNPGSIEIFSSTVNLGGSFTQAGLTAGFFSRDAASTVNLTGTITGNLTLDDGTGSWNLDGGTLAAGTFSTGGTAVLYATSGGGTLNAEKLDSPIDFSTNNNAMAAVTGGLTLNTTLQIGSADGSTYAGLVVSGTQTLGTSSIGTINLGGSGNDTLYATGGTLTLSNGLTIQGQGGGINGSGTVVNDGTIDANVAGGAVNIDPLTFTNNGTVEATRGGTIRVNPSTLSNFSSGTLSGGTWQATGGGIFILSGDSITTNAANILLDGVTSVINDDVSGDSALAGLTDNAAGGNFTIQNGADFNFNSGLVGTFTNAGNFSIGAQSTFVAATGYTYMQTSGLTQLNGGTLDGQMGGGGPTGVVIDGGTLSGSGTIADNLTVNDSGVFAPGGIGAAGTVTITGKYSQAAAAGHSPGTLDIDLGGTLHGTQYDQVVVDGTATLDGTLDVNTINGFTAAGGQSFDVLTAVAAGVSGTFATVNDGTGAPSFKTYLSREVVLSTTPAQVVTNTADSGPGSLRDAIAAVDGGPASLTSIFFDIPGSGVKIIQPQSPLPTIIQPVTIDGTTQAGYAGTPLIELDGTLAGSGINGLTVGTGTGADSSPASGGGSFIEGLAIGGFSGNGVELDAGGDVVEGNYIGTDATGATALANQTGVLITSSNNTIGGTTAAARNVISGNTADGVFVGTTSTANLIAGNFIGSDATGTIALGNTANGVEIAGFNNTVGGATAAARNVIAANVANGVLLNGFNAADPTVPSSFGNVVEGNYVGVDVSSGADLGNQHDGVAIQSGAYGNTIGGTATGAGNVIASNQWDGVLIDTTSNGNTVEGNFIGTNTASAPTLGNMLNGVSVNGPNNTIGGAATAARNVISGNIQNGVLITGATATGNTVAGNYIGTDVDGGTALPNAQNGVNLSDLSAGDTVRGNLISGNTENGVTVGGQNAPNGLAGWWPGEGDANDSVGTDNGTLVANGGDTVGFAPGKVGQAFSFDGGGAYVNVPTEPQLQSTQFTLAAWVRTLDSGRFETLVNTEALSGSGQVGYALAQSPDNHFDFVLGTQTANALFIESTTTVVPGQWYHLVGTYDGTTANFYINGVLETTGTTSVTINSTAPLTIGRLSSAGNFVHGQIDEVQVYDTALGATSVQQLYNLAAGETIVGNQIGTNAAGTAPLANGGDGVLISGRSNNTVGGATAADRNLISGNAGDGVAITGVSAVGNTIEGDFVGTNAAGTAAVANLSNGIEDDGEDNTIGAVGAANVISGNSGDGIYLAASGDMIVANLIGTDVTGSAAIANGGDGITDDGHGGNAIGAAGAGNVISGNTGDGLFIGGGGGDTIVANFIGTNAAGMAALANAQSGIDDNSSGGNTIGAIGAANVISGNSQNGVLTEGDGGDTIVANFIGTDATGTATLANQTGISITSSNNTIGGTAAAARNVISGNSGDGVDLSGGAGGNTVEGNFIGTDVSGTLALGNGADGVLVGGGAASNTVGGGTAGSGNVISANAASGVEIAGAGSNFNVVTGNFIGTDVTGTTSTDANSNSLGNGGDGVFVNTSAQSNIIGGATAAAPGVIAPGVGSVAGSSAAFAGNLIAGNLGNGVNIDTQAGVNSGPPPTSLNVVEGNFIGTDVTGANALANTLAGVQVLNEPNNTIGGTIAGSGNLISGNTQDGVLITGIGATGNVLEGNFIGTDVTGTIAVANSAGVYDVGGTTTIGAVGAGNVISGNSDAGILVFAPGDTIVANLIGTNAAGTAAVANGGEGINDQGGGTTIGAAGAGNVISGNSGDGIVLSAAGDTIVANLIGTNAAGTATIANGGAGITDDGGTTTIGAVGAANVISGNTGDGIDVAASGDTIVENDIGTNAGGTAAVANAGNGIHDYGGSTTIGAVGAGNVVSGNSRDGILVDASGDTILGNQIGTTADGSAALSNATGVEIASGTNNTIGGTAAGNGNVISGNSGDGVFVDAASSANVIAGNFVGTDASGTAALANTANGVEIAGFDNTVGGTTAAARNVIAANGANGVLLNGFNPANPTVPSSSGNAVEGNYIGTDVTGAVALGNQNGVALNNGATGDTIGGTTAAARNVISGNALQGVVIADTSSGNLVEGNYIGADAGGTLAVPNGFDGINVFGASNNTIGGAATGAGNLISGNTGDGLDIQNIAGVGPGSGNLVEGNFIGTNAVGTAPLANTSSGVGIFNAAGNTIGGAAPSDLNLISGNSQSGVLITGSAATGNLVEGDYIGTNADGTAAVANGGGISDFAGRNTIGAVGAANVISGNANLGIYVVGSGDTILANRIGTNASGTAAIANAAGIWDVGGRTTIGAVGAGNVISGNTYQGIYVGASGDTIVANLIGTNAAGTAAIANGIQGIYDVGGTTTIGAAGAGNVISGNTAQGIYVGASGDTIVANLIGTNAAGTTALGNGYDGIEDKGGTTTIGAIGAGNVISGNSSAGIQVEASSDTIVANYIGTNAAGTAAVANGGGISDNGGRNTIGAVGAANVISGNTNDGIFVSASGDTIVANLIGTNAAGTAAIANANGIADNGGMTTIGAVGAANVISGNTYNGIYLTASGDTIVANRIGTDLTGAAAIANANGIADYNGMTTIGAAGAGNVISGNTSIGIYVAASGDTIVANLIGTNAAGTAALGNGFDGIDDHGGTTTIGALNAGNVISGNSSAGIEIEASGDTIVANFIGTNADGTAAIANGGGISDNVGRNTIGAVGAANVISGNTNSGIFVSASGDTIVANRIGTNATGTAALANGANGITITDSAGNTIGGTTSADRNVISGNLNIGVLITGSSATGNVVEGNYIGTDVTGTSALANSHWGVQILNAPNNTIGGISRGAGNVISGNTQGGMQIIGATAVFNVVEGNYIGTNAAGTAAVANAGNGVADNTGESTIGAVGAGNLISGNYGAGIAVDASADTIVANYIGTNAAGTAALGNSTGIEIDGHNNTVGGTTAASRNIISGNSGVGVHIAGTTAIGNVVESNYIGTNAAGTASVANAGDGVLIAGGATNNTIGSTSAGAGNTIAFNTQDGVSIEGATSVDNAIRANSIFANVSLGIDLGGTGVPVPNDSLGHSGTNIYQNFPTITASDGGGSTEIAGQFKQASEPNTTLSLDFFLSPTADPSGYGQGQTYIGSATVTTDSTGMAGFDVTFLHGSLPGQIVTATATDAAGNTSEFSLDQAVDTPPTVTIAGGSAIVGQPDVLDSTVTDSVAGATFSYAWSVTENGNPSFTLSSATATDGPTLDFTPPDAATYQVSLAVTDNQGGGGTASTTVTAVLSAPSVAIDGNPGTSPAGAPVALTSTVTDPSGAAISSYAWSVTETGNPAFSLPTGAVTDDASFAFTPPSPGSYQVTLAVADALGAVGTASATVSVVSPAPVVAIEGNPGLSAIGSPVALTSSVTDPLGAAITSYAWSVTETGNPAFTLPTGTVTDTASFTFAPPSPGSYQVSLTVTDALGFVGAALATVTAVSPAPVVAIEGNPGTSPAGAAVALTSTVTDPLGAAITSYAWSVTETGNPSFALPTGTVTDTANFTFTPPSEGSFQVALAVTDALGFVGNAVTTVVVNLEVALMIAPSGTLYEGGTATVLATLGNPQPGQTYSFAWTVDGGAANSASNSLELAPLASGTYLVSVTATGSDGSSVTASQEIDVTNVPPTVTIAGAPTASIFEGTPVLLTTNATDPGGAADNLTYAWTVTGPDGFSQSGTSPALGFTPNEVGDYTATVAVTDSSNATTSSTVDVPVVHVAPTPTIEIAPGTGHGTFSISAVVPDPGADDTFTYAWTALDPSGNTIASHTSTSASFSFTEGPAGTYMVDLTVTDDEGGSATDSAAVLVAAPNSTLTLTTGNVPAGATQVVAVAMVNATVDASQLPSSTTVDETAMGGNDTLIGGAGPNVLQGDSNNNLLLGGMGPNTLFASANDTLVGGGGTNPNLFQIGPASGEVATAGKTANTLSFAQSSTGVTVNLNQTGVVQMISGASTLVINGAFQNLVGSSTGNDMLIAAPNSTLQAGGGNSTLMASGGSNIGLLAGSGNALLEAMNASNVAMTGGAGSDSLFTTNGTNTTMLAGSGSNTLASSGGSGASIIGGTGSDSLFTSGGTNTTMLAGSGSNTLVTSGGSGASIIGGTGSDSLFTSGGTNTTMVAGGGSNTLATSGGSGASIIGGTGSDSLFTSGGTNTTLLAGSGPATLATSGGSGTSIIGGTGSDSLFTSNGTNTTMYGGSGPATLATSGGSGASIIGGTGSDSLFTSGGTNTTLLAGSGPATLASSGGSGASIIGGTGSDSLFTSGGTNTTLLAGSGPATLVSSGGSGASIIGGTGSDSLFTSGGTNTTMVAGSGNATLVTSGGSGASIIGGTGSDSLFTSNGTNTTMLAGSGPATLATSGGSGASMIGGTGSDSLFTSNGTNTTMLAGSGPATLATSGGSGASIIGGTGSDSLFTSNGTNTTMIAGSGPATLATSGGSGASIIGGTGSDSLFTSGGTNTTMLAGGGNTTLVSSGGSGASIIGGTGSDSLFTSNGTNTTMLAGSGNATLANSGGTSTAMIGGTGSDSLFTSNGTNTTMIAGSGNTTLANSGGTGASMAGGTGSDSLFTANGTNTTMIAGSGNTTLANSGGTSTAMIGGTGNDSMFTSNGTNTTMIAGSGNTTLANSGGTGTAMIGGTGNDSLFTSGGTNTTMYGGGGNATLANSGGTGTAMIGGTGNDSLFTSNGTNTTMYGGSGNTTLANSGGSGASMAGGTGNDSLFTSAGTSTTMVGGSGNDTLASTGASGTTMTGGTGNDSLFTSNDSGTTVYGGSGNDTLLAAGGANIGLFGLQGNDTYEVTGSAADPVSVTLNDLATFYESPAAADGPIPTINTIIFPDVTNGIMLDLSNASNGATLTPAETQQVAPGITLSLTGQFNNVVGTPGDDFIKGDSVSNVLSGGPLTSGPGGDDTLVGGSGPATLVAGTGGDSLVAGTGGTTFQFPAGSAGNVTVDPPLGPAQNTLDFSQFAGPVAINLGSAAPQSVYSRSSLSLTLQDPSEINGLIDSAFADSITGNAVGDRFYVGTGNDTFTGGGGADSFFFAGTALGTDSINETSTDNALNFLGFGAPVHLDLTQPPGTPQTLSHDALTGANLNLTLANPAAFDTVVGTPYADTIVGNDNPAETLIGGGGGDSLVGGSGADYIQGDVTQVVYLDFTETPVPGNHVYTPAETVAIQARLEHDYADFNYVFTQDPAQAAQLAAPTGGAFATLVFNQGPAGGASNQIDFRNTNLGGRTTVNINSFLGDPNDVAADVAAGTVPGTSANIINLTAEIAAHELGHLSGLRHADSYGPIIDANGQPAGIYKSTTGNAAGYFPAYTGPTNATETPEHIMASPGAVGTTLLQAAGLDSAGNPTQPTYFGEREAVKLAFNDTGTIVQQAGLPTQTSPLGTAYTLPPLPSLAVPNTLGNPADVGYGQTFNVQALDVNAALTTPGEEDFYAFTGTAGQVFQFEVISATNTFNPHPFQAELAVTDTNGNLLPYGAGVGDSKLPTVSLGDVGRLLETQPQSLGDYTYTAHDFESPDSTLMGVVLPAAGTYYVAVDSFDVTAGLPLKVPVDYQLFMYSFGTGTGPSTGGGDTMVGGGGADTLVGSSGNDQIKFLSGSAGNATVLAGPGDDPTQNASGDFTVDLTNAPNEHVSAPTKVTIVEPQTTTTLSSVTTDPTFYGTAITFTATVTSQGGGTPSGSVAFEEGGVVLDTETLGPGGVATFTTSRLLVGAHSITAVYTTSANYHPSSTLSALDRTVNKATPTVTVTDGGTYDDSAIIATETVAGTVAGFDDTRAASLEGVTPSLTYYAGDTVTNTPLSGAPIQAGTYTVLASFAGSADYTSASESKTFLISPAPLSISAVSDSKPYDGTKASSQTPTVGTLYGTDSVTGLTQAFESKDVLGTNGSTLMVTHYTVNDGNNGNDYTVTLNPATGTITPAALSVSATSDSKPYDGTPASSQTPTYSGLFTVGGDTVTGLAQAFGSKDVLGSGKSTLVVSGGYSINDGNGGNDYTVTLNTATGTITPAPLSISATSDSKPYDGTPASSQTPTYSGLFTVGGDTVTGLAQAFGSKNVLGSGKSTLMVSDGYSVNDGNGGKDYTVTLNTATGTITPAPLSITATSDSKPYDGTSSSSKTTTYSGLFTVGGDTLTGLAQAFTSKDVLGSGNSTLVVSGGYSVNDGNGGNDYTVTLNTATGSITPAPLSIWAASDSKPYDGTTSSTKTPTYSGLFTVGGDTLTGLAQAFSSKDVLGSGKSTLVVSGGYSVNDGNGGKDYSVTTHTATGTITPAPLSISATSDTKTYNGTTSSTKTPTYGGLFTVGGDTLTGLAQAFSSKDVLGSGKSTLVVSGGYSVNDGNGGKDYSVTTHTATGTITAATLTVSGITANNKVYDGTTTATLNVGGAALVGVFSGDMVTLNTASATGTFASSAVANNITVMVSGLTLGGAQAGDYLLTQPKTTASIFSGITAVSVKWGSEAAALQTASDGVRLLPTGRKTDMPWPNIQTVAVTLNQSATLSAGDVSVTGIAVANYGPVTISGSATSYTIAFAKPVSKADRVTITIGNAHIATFTRRLDILPGDVNDDGAVNTTDGFLILNNTTPAHAYQTIYDMNGDGAVNTADFTLYRPFIGTVLPNLPAQLAAGGEGPGGVALLTPDELAPILTEATEVWAATGLPAVDVTRLEGVTANITALPAGYLGGAPIDGDTIYLSTDAAGYGWFIDTGASINAKVARSLAPTESAAVRTAVPAGREDLLTVVMHELGHVLGLNDVDPTTSPNDLMAETLATGVRRLSTYQDVIAVLAAGAAIGLVPSGTALADAVFTTAQQDGFLESMSLGGRAVTKSSPSPPLPGTAGPPNAALQTAPTLLVAETDQATTMITAQSLGKAKAQRISVVDSVFDMED